MPSQIRKKLATIVILFIQAKLRRGVWHFGEGFNIPKEEQIVIEIRYEPRGLKCDPDTEQYDI